MNLTLSRPVTVGGFVRRFGAVVSVASLAIMRVLARRLQRSLMQLFPM